VWKASAAEMTETMADGLVAQRVDFHGCRLQVLLPSDQACCNSLRHSFKVALPASPL